MSKHNIPNAITLFRIGLIPLLVLWNSCGFHPYGELVIIMLAAISDALDGVLARWLSAESSWGAFLDPVADKLFVTTALLLILLHHPIWCIWIPVWLILLRELAVSALRAWVAASALGTPILAVNYWGKAKTVLQCLSILALYWPYSWSVWLIGMIGLWLTSAVAWYAAWTYCAVFIYSKKNYTAPL